MLLASAGASTPFITSTPTNALLSAPPPVGLMLGLAAAGVAAAGVVSALVAFAASLFAVFASLLPAMTGAAVMASTSRLDNSFLSVDMDGALLVSGSSQGWTRIRGGTLRQFPQYCQVVEKIMQKDVA